MPRLWLGQDGAAALQLAEVAAKHIDPCLARRAGRLLCLQAASSCCQPRRDGGDDGLDGLLALRRPEPLIGLPEVAVSR